MTVIPAGGTPSAVERSACRLNVLDPGTMYAAPQLKRDPPGPSLNAAAAATSANPSPFTSPTATDVPRRSPDEAPKSVDTFAGPAAASTNPLSRPSLKKKFTWPLLTRGPPTLAYISQKTTSALPSPLMSPAAIGRPISPPE